MAATSGQCLRLASASRRGSRKGRCKLRLGEQAAFKKRQSWSRLEELDGCVEWSQGGAYKGSHEVMGSQSYLLRAATYPRVFFFCPAETAQTTGSPRRFRSCLSETEAGVYNSGLRTMPTIVLIPRIRGRIVCPRCPVGGRFTRVPRGFAGG